MEASKRAPMTCRAASTSFRSKCRCVQNAGGRHAFPSPGLPANVEYSSTGKIYRDTTDNWQPRIGLAYRLSQNTALARRVSNVL